jgi:hypothetical protein
MMHIAEMISATQQLSDSDSEQPMPAFETGGRQNGVSLIE